MNEKLELEAGDTLKTEYFLERREIGFLNIGGDAVITVDGESYELSRLDVLYVGKGKREFSWQARTKQIQRSCISVRHWRMRNIATRKMTMEEANPTHLGSLETSNERVLYKYIHGDGIQSCQLMLGVTSLKTGSVWNTMPSHVHDRRMEAYLYFDVNQDARVFHMMGEPSETRHLVVANEQAIISPPWSIHSGVGTSNYTFCWSMAGENYTFTDMDAVKMEELK